MPIIHAQPYDYAFEKNRLALVIIDMQRDFIEPGGFGAALGNDVSLLAPIIPTVASLLGAFRKQGLTVIHTKECHHPDLSDCPPAKRERGRGKLRIGDQGPMGRILINGEPGNDFVTPLKPVPGELVIAKPGKGSFYATPLDAELKRRGVTFEEYKMLISGDLQVKDSSGKVHSLKPGDVIGFGKGDKAEFSSQSSGLAFYVAQR